MTAPPYGCFVPDLTRFPGRACEGTRQAQEYMGWLQELQNFASCAACTRSAFARAVLVSVSICGRLYQSGLPGARL